MTFSSKASLPIVAAFDFDNTLTNRDSLLPFLFYMNGFFKTTKGLARLTPVFFAFLLNNLTRQEVKEKILAMFFKGLPYPYLKEWGEKYAKEQLDRYIKPEALARLRWHQQQGHRCVLISASVECYLLPWAKRYGFDEVITSCLEIDEEECVTGHLIGLNCWGEEKCKQLKEKLGPKSHYQLYAYGDSRGDRELLALADYPFYRCFQ
jgi:phosphatidylglycerophosphatase C